MITMAKIDEALRFWQDLTFADDVMEGLTVAEAAKFSSLCLKKLKQWMERNGINVFGLWKREWVRRKSGALKGSYVPHFHLVYTIKDSNEDSYLPTVSRIALKWVEITGTQEKEKALRVALHPKSFRYVESRKQMQKYMSKYLVKNDPISTEESIGRNWGRLGNLEVHNGEVIYVTEDETVFLKRCLRKIVKNPKGYFKVSLNRQATQFFVFIERTTIIRLLEWHRVNHTFEDLPF